MSRSTILNVPSTLAMALAPWAAVAMAQTTGSYPTTYLLLAGAGVAAACLILASQPRASVEHYLHAGGGS